MLLFYANQRINEPNQQQIQIKRRKKFDSLPQIANRTEVTLEIGIERTAELIEPALDAVEGTPAGDIVDDKRGGGAAVVGGSDGPKPLLAGGVPDLSLDLLAVDFHHLRLELDADRGLGVAIELIPSESREEIRFPHRGVAD